MMKKRIYYHDTDAGGVVYYANYLKYMEEARTEFFAERGISVKGLADAGTLFVVSRQETDYKLPAFYADELEISAKVVNASGARIEFEHEVKNQRGQLLVRAEALLVCVGSDIRPKPIPEELRAKII
jgi:tol-pal system-associated acyl-CoA thioesterase